MLEKPDEKITEAWYALQDVLNGMELPVNEVVALMGAYLGCIIADILKEDKTASVDLLLIFYQNVQLAIRDELDKPQRNPAQ